MRQVTAERHIVLNFEVPGVILCICKECALECSCRHAQRAGAYMHVSAPQHTQSLLGLVIMALNAQASSGRISEASA